MHLEAEGGKQVVSLFYFWSIMQLTFLCTQMRVNASKIEAKRLGLHDRSFENGTLSDPPFLP